MRENGDLLLMKNKVQVTIEGKTFTIVGEEPDEYIKQIAKYINEKFFEIKSKEEAKCINSSMISILTSINIADDYFKEVEKNIILSKNLEELKLGYNGFSYEKIKDIERQFYELKEENKNLYKEIEKIKKEKEQIEKDLNEFLIKPSENKNLD